MAFPTTRIPVISLVPLALIVLLTASTAQAQVDLSNVEAIGTEKVKITIQGGRSWEYEGPTTFEGVDDTTATLMGTLDIELFIDDDEKKIYADINNLNDLEGQIEDLIDSDPTIIVPSVDTNISGFGLAQKISAKLKRDLDLKIGVSLPFSVQTTEGERMGKLKVTASVKEARPPVCAGNSYDGIESFKASAKGVGSVKSKDEVASLDLDSETTPFDQMLGFTYTNPSATPNTALTGAIDYTGKKPLIVLDAGSVADLEENLEAIILDVAQVATTVTLGATKTSFKCGKNGDTAQWSYAADIAIDDGQEILSGKVTIKNKLGLD